VDSAPPSPAGDEHHPIRRRRLRGLLLLPVGAILLSGCTISSFGAFPGVSSQSQSTFHLWQGFTIAALIVGGLVVVLILWAVLRYRRRGDDIPPQTQYHLPLEITYTVIPILIVIGLFVATVVVENKVTANPSPAVTVNVQAFQWGWRFQYPGSDALVEGQTTEAPMFEIPVNATTRLWLQSSDVLHGFYVREFDFSRYALPGVDNEFSFYPTTTGTFFGQCSQLCGLYHSLMWFRVKVVTMAQFKVWEASFDTPAGAKAAEAAAIATQQGVSPGVPVKPTNSSGL
jgi:cytochrome c oxidase subunit II